MTDLVYLIGQALAGLIANPTIRHKDGGTATSRDMANAAVELATAALAAAGEKEDTVDEAVAYWMGIASTRDAEIARLRAELARYTEPLTQEQAKESYMEFMGGGFSALPWSDVIHATRWDAAIRKVRAGKGE